jgi:hypothetical protein
VKTSVSVGATSVLGWMAALLGLAPTIVKSIEEGTVAFGGPEKWLAIAGIIFGAITQIGRYLQAHGLIKAEAAEEVAKLESTPTA